MACNYKKVTVGKSNCTDKKSGGVGKSFFLGNLPDLSAFVRDSTTKVLTGLTLAEDALLYEFQGRVLSSNVTESGAYGDDQIVRWTPTVTLLADYATQVEKEALQGVLGKENLFVIFYEVGRKQWVAVGIPPATANIAEALEDAGLAGTAYERGTGTAKADSTAATLTIAGELDFGSIDVLIGSGTPSASTTLTALRALTVATP